MKLHILVTTMAALCLAAPGAYAQEAVAPRPRHSLVLEGYAFTGTFNERATTVVAPALFANFALSKQVTLMTGWIFAYAPTVGGGAATFQPGNPFIGLGFVLRDDALKIRTGASMSFPFTLITDPDNEQSAVLRTAAALRGNSAFSLVAPGLMGVTPWMDANLRLGLLRLGVDARIPMAAQLSSRRGERVDVVFQVTGTVGLDVTPNLLVGTSLQGIYISTAPEGMDPSFVALVPSLRWYGSAGFVEGRLTINLDEPLGYSFRGNRIWGLGLSMGTNF